MMKRAVLVAAVAAIPYVSAQAAIYAQCGVSQLYELNLLDLMSY